MLLSESFLFERITANTEFILNNASISDTVRQLFTTAKVSSHCLDTFRKGKVADDHASARNVLFPIEAQEYEETIVKLQKAVKTAKDQYEEASAREALLHFTDYGCISRKFQGNTALLKNKLFPCDKNISKPIHGRTKLTINCLYRSKSDWYKIVFANCSNESGWFILTAYKLSYSALEKMIRAFESLDLLNLVYYGTKNNVSAVVSYAILTIVMDQAKIKQSVMDSLLKQILIRAGVKSEIEAEKQIAKWKLEIKTDESLQLDIQEMLDLANANF